MSDVTEPVEGERAWTPEALEEVRTRAKEVMGRDRISQQDASRESGIPAGTLSSFLAGTYAARQDRQAERVVRWLDTRAVRQQTQSLLPTVKSFVATPTAEAFMALFRNAQHMPDWSVVLGAPGVGKTSAACAYMRRTPNVWKITAHPCLSSPRAMLEEFGRAVGVWQPGHLHKMQQHLVARLRGAGALLMVDEAHFLTPMALEQLRSVHDQAEVGVVLLGNATVNARLEGDGRSVQYAQLTSRVGMRLSRSKPEAGDVDAMLDAHGIDGEAERKQLRQIARRPGALRVMIKAIRLGQLLAAQERVPLAVGHIRAAAERLALHGNGDAA